MSRVGLLLLVVVIGSGVGCNCGDGSAKEPGQTAGRATVESAAKPPEPAPVDRHPLAGTWRGHATTTGYGVVVGTVTIGDLGAGTATVTARGLTFVEAIAVEEWDGEWLRVTVAGASYLIAARREGEILEANLPLIGWTKLERR